ncbi:BRO-N domain-containing protein [Kiloniella majae]|uniref:BRO-N domain-containing protein n=1 Tax=Kiloniella majae TaxID=1938558 RepID=UPI000A278D7C|nr:BRO family protein [Kiloniella majae]
MPKAHATIPSKITFENTELSIIDRDGRPWIASSDLAKALGYDRTDKVSQVYQRNSDEFNEEMSQTLKMKVRGQVAPTQHRLFSPRGAHLIAMFARTPKAKAFRKWVLDVLEGMESKPVTVRAHTRKKPTISTEERARAALDKLRDSRDTKHSNIRAELRDLFRSTLAESKRLAPLSLTWGEAGSTFPKAERLMTEASIQAFSNNNEEALRNLYEAASLYRDTLKNLEGKALIPWH